MHIFDELTRTTTDQKLPLGTMRTDGSGNSYMYVQLVAGSTSAVTNGAILYQVAGSAKGYVTTAGVAKTLNLVRGVGIGAIAKSSFGWIQTWGTHSAIDTNGDDDIATGDALIGVSGDGNCDSVAAATAPTNKVIGWATSADVDSQDTVAGHIEIEKAT